MRLFGEQIAEYGVTPYNVYYFMQGHTLLDNVIITLLHAVCDKLRDITTQRINMGTKQGVALKNEISNYNNALRNVREVLLDNEHYKDCFLYHKLQKRYRALRRLAEINRNRISIPHMADAIKNFPARLYKMTETFCHEVPSQVAVRRFVDELTNVMFPVRDDKHISEVQIAARWGKTPTGFSKNHLSSLLLQASRLQRTDSKVFRRDTVGLHRIGAGCGNVQHLRSRLLLHRRSYPVLPGILRHHGLPHRPHRLPPADPGTAQGDDRVRAQPDRNRHQPGAQIGPISTSTTAPAS